MSRILIIANTEGGQHTLHITAGADVDLLEVNDFLVDESVFDVDYEPTDYVNYVDGLADFIKTKGDAWSDTDREVAANHLECAVNAIRGRFGRRLAESLSGKDLKRARQLSLIP